jgi:hypothetical protein
MRLHRLDQMLARLQYLVAYLLRLCRWLMCQQSFGLEMPTRSNSLWSMALGMRLFASTWMR